MLLLSYMPSMYLKGLTEVVLTNASDLSRKQRRSKTISGSRIPDVRGLYHQAERGQGAWIELFVDNVLVDYPNSAIVFPIIRNFAFAEVLYHEIAHHAQATLKIKTGDHERFADDFAFRLTQKFIIMRYWYLAPLIYLIRASVKTVTRLMKHT
jgi:hypothetical protein